MTDQELTVTFFPRLSGLWPRWNPKATERNGWLHVMRQYSIQSAMQALQAYWEQESKRPRPVPADFVRMLRFVPEADRRTDGQRRFEEAYYGLSPIAMRLVDLEMCRRRLVRNQYDRPGERFDDERRQVTLQAFADRQSSISAERLASAERDADAMLAAM